MLNKFSTLVWTLAIALLVAGLPVTAETGGRGALPVAAGGGSIRGALFNTGEEGDATFSFFAGYDKHGEPTGSFMLKRVTSRPGDEFPHGDDEFPGQGVRAVVSTDVEVVEVGFDECPYVKMAGRTALHAWWVDYPQVRREYFFLQAWDCDGIDHLADMVWFGVYRDLADPDDRPALTLWSELPNPGDYEPVALYPVELTHGNIHIRSRP